MLSGHLHYARGVARGPYAVAELKAPCPSHGGGHSTFLWKDTIAGTATGDIRVKLWLEGLTAAVEAQKHGVVTVVITRDSIHAAVRQGWWEETTKK